MITKLYRDWKRSRPYASVLSLFPYLVPDVLPERSQPQYVINLGACEDGYPEEFQPLDGTRCYKGSGKFQEVVYNRYFERVGFENVTVPKNAGVAISRVNLKLPAKWESEDKRFGYFFTGEADYHYLLPSECFEKIPDYTVWLHVNRLPSADLSVKVDLMYDATVYLILGTNDVSDARWRSLGCVPLFTSNHQPDCLDFIEGVLSWWEANELIPTRGMFVTEDGEDLAMEYKWNSQIAIS